MDWSMKNLKPWEPSAEGGHKLSILHGKQDWNSMEWQDGEGYYPLVLPFNETRVRYLTPLPYDKTSPPWKSSEIAPWAWFPQIHGHTNWDDERGSHPGAWHTLIDFEWQLQGIPFAPVYQVHMALQVTTTCDDPVFQGSNVQVTDLDLSSWVGSSVISAAAFWSGSPTGQVGRVRTLVLAAAATVVASAKPRFRLSWTTETSKDYDFSFLSAAKFQTEVFCTTFMYKSYARAIPNQVSRVTFGEGGEPVFVTDDDGDSHSSFSVVSMDAGDEHSDDE